MLADRHEVLGAFLDEGGLVLEDLKSLFESVDLGLAPCLLFIANSAYQKAKLNH